jgi:RHS repeat-associated protein
MERMKKIIASALIFVFISSLVPANVFAASLKDSKNDLKDQDVSTTSIGKIVGETTDKREKSTKVYRKDDGSFEAAIFDTAVHYKDSQGQWKDIDNSLIDVKDEKGNDILKNKENSFDVEISKNANSDKLVNIKKDGYELSWNIAMSQSASSSSTALTDSTNLLSSDKAATDPLETTSETASADSSTTTSGSISTDSSVAASSSPAMLQSTPASVSAAVEQIDETSVQNSIDKIAQDKASRTQGYDKLSDTKKDEVLQTTKHNEQQKTLRKISSAVDFENVFNNIDLRYELIGDAVKENIVIRKAIDNAVFKFNINAANLVPKVDTNNDIIFYDEKDAGKVVYIIKAPYMYDANKESSDKISISIEKSESGYLLTVKPDSTWLNDTKRAFPVTIDPTVTPSIDITSIQDSYVSSADPNTNFYNSILLKTGYGSLSGTDRTYIRFAELPKLTSGEMITGAWLELVCYTTEGSYVNAHEVLSGWDSTSITWNNKPSYNSTIEDYQNITAGSARYFWNITNIAKKWYSSENNYGVLLKANNETCGYTDYVSSDTTINSLRPIAYITYVSNVGLENYWTYHSTDAGRAGVGHINDYTGSLTYIHNNLTMDGLKMPVAINHVYNSSEATENTWSHQWMGAGWTMNVMQRVDRKQIEGTYYWVYTDEDGTKIYFEDKGTAELTDELNLGYTFSTDGEGYHYIKDKTDNKLKFYYNGYLYGIIDNNGNEMHAVWCDVPSTNVKKLTTLTDGAGRVTHLNYDGNGILLSITDPANRVTNFTYDYSDNYQKLMKITYPDNKETNFTYEKKDDKYLLSSITNIDGTKVSYTYYACSPFRVQSVVKSNSSDQKTSDQLNFSYGNNVTTLTDCNNRKNIYQFNNFGQTVSVQDADGNASYYDYADSGNKCKSTLESKLQKTQTNFIVNHNMEANSNWTPSIWGGATGTQTYTTEDKYMGYKSMKITSTSTNGGLDYEQSGIQLERDKPYIFSGYIKTIGVSGSSDNNTGAIIFVGYHAADGTLQYFKKYVNGTTDWHREELQFTLPSNAQNGTVFVGCEIIGATGTAYFDCVQLEEGSIANRYNLVENPDFKYGTSFWTKNDQCSSEDKIVTAGSDHPRVFDNSAFSFVGQPDKRKNLLQTINISGKANDTLVVGGWSKADSSPIYGSRNFGITVGFKLPSGDYEWHDSVFNTDSTQWQYLSKKIVAKSDYTQVVFYVIYYNNVNSAMFDGMQLYKEEFGSSYTYDSKGNVLSCSDLSEKNSTFEYNGANDLVKYISPKGGQFTYDYDTSHNIKEAKTATNITYSFTYSTSGNTKGNPVTAMIGDSTKNITSSVIYTDDGNYVKKLTDSSNNSIEYSRNDKYLLSEVKDANGHATSYGYNSSNLLETVSTKVNGTEDVSTSYSYDKDRLSSITHNGFSYNFGYDGLGNNTKVSIGSWEAANSIHLIENTYDDGTGNLKELKYGNQKTVSFEYDNLDRVSSKKYDGEEKFAYQYDGNGNLGYKKDKIIGVSYRYIYDLANRLVQIFDDKGNSTTFGYESKNNPINTITWWHYSGDGRTYHDVIVQLSNDPTFKTDVKTVYNNDANNSSGIGVGTDAEYAESSSGKVIQVGALNYRYVRLYSNGSSVNGYNHYVEVKVDGSSGNMSSGKSITSSKAFVNPNRVTDGDTNTNSYADSSPNTGLQWIQIDLGASSGVSNNLTSISETLSGQKFTTNHTYDLDNRETQVTFNRGNVVSYLINTYEANKIGRLENKTINTGSANYSTAYEYTQGKEEDTKTTTTKVKSITNKGSKISYEYDKNGNITTISQDDIVVITYHYNELNELTREDNNVIGKTITYSYDTGGNITGKAEYGYTKETDLGTSTATHSYTYGTDTIWEDLLKEYDGTALSYDGIGNLTQIGNTWSFTWEAGRQLQSANKTGLNITYKYDDSGIRTQKTVNNGTTNVTTNYHLVGDKVTYEYTDNTKIYYTYDSNGQLVSMNLSTKNPDNTWTSAEYYYIKNAQGDIIGLFDSTGTQVVSYTYDTWGKVISTTGTLASTVGVKNPYRYREYRYDAETQLYYLQSRYYNPEWGRFINADCIVAVGTDISSANMYSYCNNNPVNLSDSTGQYFGLDDAIAGIVGMAVGIASQFVSDMVTSHCSGSFQMSSWQTYGGAAVGGAVGGVASLYFGPYGLMIGAVVGSGVSTLVGQTLENATGSSNRSGGEIITNAMIDGAIGGLVTKLAPIKISGVTSGINNMGAVFSSGLTKLDNKTANTMSLKVMGKGTASGIVSGLGISGVAGYKSYITNSVGQFNHQNGLPDGPIYWCTSY